MRTIETLTCDTIESLPTIQQLLQIPRSRKLKIIFSPPIHALRESTGADWQKVLIDFNVGVHLLEPEINVSKLISNEEIVEHAAFFEDCARDYRREHQTTS